MKANFILTTCVNRTKQGDIKLFLVSISSWGSRVVVALCQLLIMKLLLSTLGVQQYAVFTLVISLASWFLIMDFGFSQMIHNHIGALGGEDKDNFLWSGFFYVLVFQIIIMSLLYIFDRPISELVFSGFTFLNEKTRCNLLNNISWVLCLNTISNYFVRVLYAKGKGIVANCLASIGAVVGITLIYLVHMKFDSSLSLSVMLYFLPTIFFNFLYCALTFGSKAKLAIINKKQYRVALGFFYISLMSVLTLQVDYFFLSHYVYDKNDVVVYNIITKLFSFVFFICYSVLLAVWPEFNRLAYNNDFSAMKKFSYKFILFSSMLILIFTVIMCFLRNDVVAIFSGSSKHVDVLFIVLVGLYNIVMLFVAMYSVMLQSANLLRIFYIVAPLQASVSMFMQYSLVHLWGLDGVVIALILSYLLVPVIFLPREFYKKERVLG